MSSKHPYDNSQLNLFQICPHKYYLKYIRGIERADTEGFTVDLDFGSHYHSFLEAHYKGELKNPEYYWQDYPLVPGEEVKTKEAGVAMCLEYLRNYQNVDKDYKVLAVEKPVRFKVGDYEFLVKLDTVVEYLGNIYSLEHKTTGSLWYNYFDRYFINSQISAQTYAVKKEFGQCSGVILSVAEVKNYKRKYKDRSAGLSFKFERELINRVPQEVDSWYENALLTIEEIEECKETEVWRRSDGGGACSMFRGCTFKQLCKSSVGMKIDEQVEDVLYAKVSDPYAYMYG